MAPRNFIAAARFYSLTRQAGAISNAGTWMLDDPFGGGVAPCRLPMSGLLSPIRPGFVVAIPVRDEEERLPACLRALAQQRNRLGQSIPPTLVRIVLFANNCTDQSADLARKLGRRLSLDVRVVEARLPLSSAHAGAARREVMDLAEEWLQKGGESDGVILTTDADSQVDPDWLVHQLRLGADMVLGVVRIDDWRHHSADFADRYVQAYDADGEAAGRHAHVHGANMGFSAGAYWRVGGFRPLPSGEDVDLVARFEAAGYCIHRDAELSVTTSARSQARAPHGFAHHLTQLEGSVAEGCA